MPAYDKWFDDVRQALGPGERHRGSGRSRQPGRASIQGRLEVAAQSGHDLFQFLLAAGGVRRSWIALNDVVQQVERKVGRSAASGGRASTTANEGVLGFSRTTTSRTPSTTAPISGERSGSGLPPENIRRAAPRLKAMGNPVGIGMSQEFDSNMALIALLQCFGAYIQNADARITIKSKGTRDALNFMRDPYRSGMTTRCSPGRLRPTTPSRRPALAGVERDLDRAQRRAAEPALQPRHRSGRSSTGQARAWASST